MSTPPYRIQEIEHRYGEGVHILDDPFLTTQLARLCAPATTQPLFNALIRQLYTSLIRAVINVEYPQVAVEIDTTIRHTKPDSWIGNPMKEKKVKRAIREALPEDFDPQRLDALFDLVKVRDEYR